MGCTQGLEHCRCSCQLFLPPQHCIVQDGTGCIYLVLVIEDIDTLMAPMFLYAMYLAEMVSICGFWRQSHWPLSCASHALEHNSIDNSLNPCLQASQTRCMPKIYMRVSSDKHSHDCTIHSQSHDCKKGTSIISHAEGGSQSESITPSWWRCKW